METSNLFGEAGGLQCPSCEEEFLHHEQVTSYWGEEDADGSACSSGVDGFSRGTVSRDDMPGRRDAVRIRFWCEYCDQKPVLLIMQHKGMTLLDWEYAVERIREAT